MEINTYVIKNNNANIRLDKALSQLNSDLSRARIQKIIEEQKVLVNNKPQKASYKVQEEDIIKIEIEKAKEIELKEQDIPLDILYEDNDIIVVNKPKGLVVHPGNGNPDGTLVNAIMKICHSSLSGIGGEIRPGIIHRLDKDTSGVIIVAKNDLAHINISNQIKNREVKKTYIALVRGIVKENEATINMPIGRSKTDRKKMAVRKDGKEAITHFKVLQRFQEGVSLLEIRIDTGRTHQIRVHMSEIGYPVVGDYTYSNGKNSFGVTGQCLHAAKIEFKKPSSNQEMCIEAPLPEYFNKIIEELNNPV